MCDSLGTGAEYCVFDPQAEIDVLQAIEADIRGRVVEARNCEEVIKVLNDSFSNAIQLTEAKGCLTDDPAKEIEEMARIYLETARVGRARELSSSEKIVLTMEEAWEVAGISWRVKALPVEPYTAPGDSFRFDFGYFVGKEIKFFHALSLRARVDSAVTLAARYPKIEQAIEKCRAFSANAPADSCCG